MKRTVSLTLALSSLAPHVHADLLVVDPLGGGTHLSIEAALGDAVDGDVLLVREGTYSSLITLTARTVEIVADTGAQVVLTEPLAVRQLAASDHVVLSGLELRSGFSIHASEGEVLLQDCVVPEPPPAMPPPWLGYWLYGACGIGGSGQEVYHADRVSIVGGSLRGADGATVFVDGGPGLHGLSVRFSTVQLMGVTLVGGDGGTPVVPWTEPVYGGAGGDGVNIGTPSVVLHAGLDASGGEGYPGSASAFAGCTGVPIFDTNGSATPLASPHVELEVPAVVRGGATVQARLTGAAPGAVIVLVSSQDPAWRSFGPSLGVLLVGQPMRRNVLGIADGSGSLVAPLTLEHFGSSSDVRTIQYQAVALGASGRALSSPRRVIVVDAAL